MPLDERFNLFSQCICAPSPQLPRHDTCGGCAREYVRAGWRSAALQPRRENVLEPQRALLMPGGVLSRKRRRAHTLDKDTQTCTHAGAEDDTRA